MSQSDAYWFAEDTAWTMAMLWHSHRHVKWRGFSPGAKWDGKSWYVYGETLSCPIVMEMWRNHLASPGVSAHSVRHHSVRLPQICLDLIIDCICVCVCSDMLMNGGRGISQQSSDISPMPILAPPFFYAFLFEAPPPQMEISYRRDWLGNSFTRHFIIHL